MKRLLCAASASVLALAACGGSLLRRGVLIAAIALLATGGVAAAAKGKPPYRTDHQAEQYLEHGLHRWDGINLRTTDGVSAFCINGYYSKHEQRTHKHYPQGRETRAGETVFRSFACDLTIRNRSFNLYLVTTRRGWRVSADH